ncbi:MAG: DMT family transporter [Acidobacteria bacterium]|nr:DMT family transporter [Acidobacteriota bacterium]
MPRVARFALLFACLLWAVSFVATKVALETTPPLLVVSLRLVISALCFLPFLLTGKSGRLGRPRILAQLFGLSLLGTGLHYGIQTVGLQHTTATNASLFAVTGPITILLLSAVVLHEKISMQKASGVAIAVVGVLVVMGRGTLSGLDFGGHALGDVMVLISIVMWGMFTVFGKRLTDELGAMRVTAVATAMGAVWMMPVGWLESRGRGFSLLEITIDAWVAIGFLGVGCSFLATLLYFSALERTESQKVGVYLYAIPPMTAAFAALMLGEVISANLVAGSLLVISGVALTERAPRI